MDVLVQLFPDRPFAALAAALERAGDDVEAAADLLLIGDGDDFGAGDGEGEGAAEQDEGLYAPSLFGDDFLEDGDEEDAPLPGFMDEGEPIDYPHPLHPRAGVDDLFGDNDSDSFPTNAGVGREQQQQEQAQPETFRPRSQDETVVAVLELFPDVCEKHISALWTEHATREPDIVTYIVSQFIENPGYPKSTPKDNKRKRRISDEGMRAPRIDYESKDRKPPPPEDVYLHNCRKVLSIDFPVIPDAYIRHVMKQNNDLYLPTYLALKKVDTSAENGNLLPYKPMNIARRRNAAFGMILASDACAPIREEIEYWQAKQTERMSKEVCEKERERAERENEEFHELIGGMVECGCCFAEVPINRVSQCEDGHLFCLECCRRNAETEIGMRRYQLKCMDGSGCKSLFVMSEVRHFLPEKNLEALLRIQQEEELRMADLEGLVRCPFCDYAEVIENPDDKEFRCKNEGCLEVSCRLCQLKSHIPKSCEEVAQDQKIDVRHAVEEAMSQALIRNCNSCKTPFFKEEGCNKMTCTKCRHQQCYICGVSVKNYDHFHDVRDASGRIVKKTPCPLYDDTHARNDQEVKAASEAAIAKQRVQRPDMTEEELRISVSKQVEADEARRKQATADYHARHNIRHEQHVPHPPRPAPVVALAPPPPLPVRPPAPPPPGVVRAPQRQHVPVLRQAPPRRDVPRRPVQAAPQVPPLGYYGHDGHFRPARGFLPPPLANNNLRPRRNYAVERDARLEQMLRNPPPRIAVDPPVGAVRGQQHDVVRLPEGGGRVRAAEIPRRANDPGQGRREIRERRRPAQPRGQNQQQPPQAAQQQGQDRPGRPPPPEVMIIDY
ncbi:hypothetical protein SAICODRAFT_89121 [Saitoella complicata NRRL Y-17804]|nr:uncharacterized protein SAICODRAFT_89121 [Saitoella complicata NRRL Y-17804]ODQ55001.1 hypothetical protein SAICODRAFT_89121 [Saitoella complicata NRRL Y-17804]